MNVLSLFDGMSCGQIALNRCGIKYDKYYASEIKKHAIAVTQHNYPNTIQLGDITKIKGSDLDKIDLLIGGSPCQDFSRQNKERLGLKGSKSSLFFEWVRLWKETKPKYFLLENVVMEDKDLNFISDTLGVSPIFINSALVSAQNRERYYWTNIPGTGVDLFGNNYIEQPKDKGIKFIDILEKGNINNATEAYIEYAKNAIYNSDRPIKIQDKSRTILCEAKCLYEINGGYRYITKKEAERLQTVPEGYTSILSEKEGKDLLGDGWTIDVICHIFQGLKKESEREA